MPKHIRVYMTFTVMQTITRHYILGLAAFNSAVRKGEGALYVANAHYTTVH